ncbi:sensor histidine kinase [Cellulomonas sp. PhB143]|uniref:sensor histidine kinase n=1 Tax=Cellulomonas sp. PhB143 TaxID=2485186 RepID=UPI0011CE8FA7|nr:sensor histidine kinase [Cellulomonas sp. PhB143]
MDPTARRPLLAPHPDRTADVPGARAAARDRRTRWMRFLGPLFGLVWLIFLLTPGGTAWDAAPGLDRAASLFGILGVAAIFAAVIVITRHYAVAPRLAWALIAVQLGCVALSCLVPHTEGLNGLVFVCVGAVFLLRSDRALIVVAVCAVAALAVPPLMGWPGDDSLVVSVVLASTAVLGFVQLIERNRQLRDAQDENAALAVARERERIARDMHDVLGHSLTVISVKAELAGRLLGPRPEQAASEVAEIQSLARAALADVRGMVASTREVSLAGELAGARAVLDAAGVAAEVPGAVDDVPESLREVFAWGVREGTTNVLRHADASRVRITLGPDRLTVEDDGVGPSRGVGNGLPGLRARAREAGAVLETGASDLGGFRLTIRATPPGGAGWVA